MALSDFYDGGLWRFAEKKTNIEYLSKQPRRHKGNPLIFARQQSADTDPPPAREATD